MANANSIFSPLTGRKNCPWHSWRGCALPSTPERMLPGGKLHPDLMGPPGVEGDVRQTERSILVWAVAAMRYSSTASFTPLRGRLHREDPAFAAVLEEIVPQQALGGERFVRAACNHSPVLLDKTRAAAGVPSARPSCTA